MGLPESSSRLQSRSVGIPASLGLCVPFVSTGAATRVTFHEPFPSNDNRLIPRTTTSGRHGLRWRTVWVCLIAPMTSASDRPSSSGSLRCGVGGEGRAVYTHDAISARDTNLDGPTCCCRSLPISPPDPRTRRFLSSLTPLPSSSVLEIWLGAQTQAAQANHP